MSHEWPMNISVDLNFWWLNQLFSSSQVHGHKAGWHGGRSAQGQLRCSDLNSNTDLMGYSWGLDCNQQSQLYPTWICPEIGYTPKLTN